MNKYKAVILGPQCSGKTTLKQYLSKKNPTLPLIEEDEVFVELNDSSYPKDIEYKKKVLRPKLEEKIRNSDNLIFLTSYCNEELLQELKDRDFKIIQLVLELDEFHKRNERRMEEKGFDDAREWMGNIFDFHKRVYKQGLVDKRIDASLPVEEVADEVLSFIK